MANKQDTLRQVSYVQYHEYLGGKFGTNGGEVGFTDGSFVWFTQEGIEQLDPKIGDGLMVNNPLRRRAG